MTNKRDEKPSKSEEKLSEFLRKLDEELTDPITHSRIEKPVIGSDGFLYEETTLKKWLQRMGIRAISPRTGKVLPSAMILDCPQIKNILGLLNQYDPQATLNDFSRTDKDLEYAMQLHEEELKQQLAKKETQINEARFNYQDTEIKFNSAMEDFTRRLNYYEQTLSVKETELEQLRREKRQLETIIQGLSKGGGQTNLSTMLQLAKSQANLQIVDISEQPTLSYAALVAILKQNPDLKIIHSGLYEPSGITHAHKGWCDKIIPLPDGTFLTGSIDSTIKQWDLHTLTLIREYNGHSKPTYMDSRRGQIYDIAVSPNNKHFASASGDGTTIIWDFTNGARVKTLKGHHENGICCVAFIDENTLATGSRDKRIIVWDITREEPKQTFTGHHADVYGLVYIKRNHQLVSSSGDAQVMVWDLRQGKCIHTFTNHDELTYALIKSANESFVISGSDDHTIRVWDTQTWNVRVLTGHQHFVNTLAMRDDTTLISGSEDHTIKIWNIVTGVCLNTIRASGKIWGIMATENQILAADTDGVMTAYKKRSFNLSFREHIRTAFTENNISQNFEQLTVSIKTPNMRESQVTELIQFLTYCLESSSGIKISYDLSEKKVIIACDNNKSRQDTYNLLQACANHNEIQNDEKLIKNFDAEMSDEEDEHESVSSATFFQPH